MFNAKQIIRKNSFKNFNETKSEEGNENILIYK